MDIFSILQLLSGLALFLYGMNTMGDGLEKFSGGKLEKTLEKMTTILSRDFCSVQPLQLLFSHHPLLRLW